MRDAILPPTGQESTRTVHCPSDDDHQRFMKKFRRFQDNQDDDNSTSSQEVDDLLQTLCKHSAESALDTD